MFHKTFDLEQLQTEVGEMMDTITDIMYGFLQLDLTKEEYVCLQVILLLNHSKCAVYSSVCKIVADDIQIYI